MGKNIKLTANDITNVKDIRDGYLYTKDGYMMVYIRVHKVNIELMTKQELAGKTNALASSAKERQNFDYMSYPREVELDWYKESLEKRFSEEEEVGYRRILQAMVQEAYELATNGENYEHQHYIKLWQYIGTKEDKDVRNELTQRATEMVKKYGAVGIESEILKTADIMKLCNLFAHASQVSYDIPQNEKYEPLTMFR